MPAPWKADWGRDYTYGFPTWNSTPRTSFDASIREEGGEDWWYDLCVLRDGNGDQIGYAAAGYNTMPNWGFKDALGCGDSEPTGDPNEKEFETLERRKGELRCWLARYDMNGEMVWCRSYFAGTFYGVTQDVDGHIVAVGEASHNRMGENDPDNDHPTVRYNPGINTNDLAVQDINCASLGYGNMPPKPLAMKVDIEGNEIWSNLYGSIQDLNPTSWGQGGRFNAVDVIQLPGGAPGLYMVAEDFAMPGAPDDNLFPGVQVIRTDENGTVVDMNSYQIDDPDVPAGVMNMIPYNVDTWEFNGQLHGLISGSMFMPVENICRAFLWHVPDMINAPFTIDPNFNLTTESPAVAGAHADNATQVSTDAELLVHNGTLYAIWPVLSDYLYGSPFQPDAVATLKVHGLPISNPSSGWTTDLGEVRAFDLRAGIQRTADGNVAVVSSRWEETLSASNPFCYYSLPPATESCINTDFPGASWNSGGSCGSNVFQYWNTDAVVFKLAPSDGSLIWRARFDSEPDETFGCWPNNIRKNECMYQIVEDDDGGLIICGNTSNNFDDAYLARLGDECQARLEYAYLNDLVDGVYTLAANDYWDTDRNIYGTIVVPDGFTLTIADCTIRFADTEQVLHPTRIIVEAGGSLVVNNATLTSVEGCPNSMWDGVQLRGDEFASQGTGTAGLEQGYMSLKNSTISNARIGVNLASVDFIPPSNPKLGQRSGGILLAYDSYFRNNRYDVTFSPYENFVTNDPTQILPNRSLFTRCAFETTGPLNVATLYPKDHVVLSMVRGIQFRGCTFSNALVGTQYQLTSHQGTGIHSLNSSFVVRNDCNVITQVGDPCPVESTTTSSFANLHRGVLATTFDLSRTFSITDADFDRVNFGIRMEGVQNAAINRNTFDVAEPFVPGLLGPTYGIYSDQCTGYSIQENSFTTSSPAGLVKKVGLVIKDSGPDHNEFYNNSFEQLFTGSIIQGRNADTNNDNMFGLEVKCNDYGLTSQNTFDVALTGDNVRVQKTQGSAIAFPNDPQELRNPAGNRFSVSHALDPINSDLMV